VPQDEYQMMNLGLTMVAAARDKVKRGSVKMARMGEVCGLSVRLSARRDQDDMHFDWPVDTGHQLQLDVAGLAGKRIR
jgi:hypothetical protein